MFGRKTCRIALMLLVVFLSPFRSSHIDGASAEAESAVARSNEYVEFEATAYCLKGLTASGEPVQKGIIAADPRLLPLGTIVHIRAGKYTGRYKVLDTGRLIKGRRIDIYISDWGEAVSFGRRSVKLKVLARPHRAR
jgi:3D (Asp-Asp-Asp) domain-containing protein